MLLEMDWQSAYNQKYWLIEALAKENSTTSLLKALKVLQSRIHLKSHTPMMNALLELIEWFIEPIYRFLSPTRYNGKKTQLADFPVTTAMTEQNSEYYQSLLDEE